jgi:hypothetical protein
MIHTYNEYHLGDQLVHLHYLRKVCEDNPHLEFTHHCNLAHHEQLRPLIEDMPIQIADLYVPAGAINAWIGHANFYYEHPHRADWVKFMLAWFERLSSVLEVNSPIACREELLFDYPALKGLATPSYDYLVINSPPLSNQLPSYHPNLLTNLVRQYLNEGKSVITTYPTGMTECTLDMNFSVTDIGSLSRHVDHIIGVATGPMWTTFNIYNLDTVKSRTFYCAHQTVNLTDNTTTLQKL